MSHQKYPSHDPIKEPHSVSVKVLRLSQPALVTQHPIAPSPLTPPPSSSPSLTGISPLTPASLAYAPGNGDGSTTSTNPDPFFLTPILNLPISFGSAYVGETFSCTLCANNDLPPGAAKQIRDVRIEAEMKTPGLGGPQKLELGPAESLSGSNTVTGEDRIGGEGAGGIDLAPGHTLQKIVSFSLKEEGNHVLAVTVSYYEATETSGRTRTFRKLYQFICKASLIVRTKVSSIDGANTDPAAEAGTPGRELRAKRRKWVLEAQLENCSEEVIQLEKVVLDVEEGLSYQDCNWEESGGDKKPVLHPTEIEQVCFVVQEKDVGSTNGRVTADERLIFGILGISWRGEMGSRGYLSTGKLGARIPSR